MKARDIFIAIAKANGHPEPESYADLCAEHLPPTSVENPLPESVPEPTVKKTSHKKEA